MAGTIDNAMLLLSMLARSLPVVVGKVYEHHIDKVLHVGLHQILAGNVVTCLEPLLICQCRFKFWGGLRSNCNCKKGTEARLNTKTLKL